MKFLKGILFLLAVAAAFAVRAQEYALPLQENAVVKARSGKKTNTAHRPTVISLPFFEDFTGSDPYPDPEKWADHYVYINNTMGWNMISRGVATFDALNDKGNVYDSTIAPYTQIYADSLTSLPIDLSGNQPADSLYLSFFYQTKGYGFSPKPYDSLMLYFLKSNGTWEKVWSESGDTLQPFRQVMIPVTDTGYFNDNFQMRWLNKATKGISDSHWNLDYIRLDAGRTWNNTQVRDIAFTRDPASILNDFTAMPFRHFKTNPSAFLNSNLTATLQNNGTTSQNIPVAYRASVVAAGTTLGTGNTNANLPPNAQTDVNFPMYNAGSFTPANPNGRVVYDDRFYCTSNYPGESRTNDTILFRQVFDNYFAYDDGTAEQSYFLNLLPSAPGATAVEYALYMPDTLRGIAIRFARELPSNWLKEFGIGVYRDIAYNGGSDDLVYQENFLYPHFVDTINKFTVYQFSQPVLLNAGVFYISIIQPAGGTSDSLQIALDANRTGGNHRYFKVETAWQSSALGGALLLRPLVGAPLPLGIKEAQQPQLQWTVNPNPAMDRVHVSIPALRNRTAAYSICDMTGRQLLQGSLRSDTDIGIETLKPGIYLIRVHAEAGYAPPVKLLKL